jgi:hypothetical protein
VCDKKLTAENIEELFNEIGIIIAEYEQDHIQISHFSDSVVISIKNETASPTQLRFIVNVLIKLLEYKLTARGSIVYGEIVHTKKNVYGPALVKAVELEKKAIYPRIILDESLDEQPLPTIGNAQINYRDFFNNFKFVKTDITDNQFYIDYIGELNKKETYKTARNNLEELIRSGVKQIKLFDKYEWLRIKYEDFRKQETGQSIK